MVMIKSGGQADLNGANLTLVKLTKVNLYWATLSEARLNRTILSNCDLNEVSRVP